MYGINFEMKDQTPPELPDIPEKVPSKLLEFASWLDKQAEKNATIGDAVVLGGGITLIGASVIGAANAKFPDMDYPINFLRTFTDLSLGVVDNVVNEGGTVVDVFEGVHRAAIRALVGEITPDMAEKAIRGIKYVLDQTAQLESVNQFEKSLGIYAGAGVAAIAILSTPIVLSSEEKPLKISTTVLPKAAEFLRWVDNQVETAKGVVRSN